MGKEVQQFLMSIEYLPTQRHSPVGDLTDVVRLAYVLFSSQDLHTDLFCFKQEGQWIRVGRCTDCVIGASFKPSVL